MTHDRSATSNGALDDIRGRIGDLNPPVELRTSVADHIAHLQKLAKSLRSVGMDETAIDQHVLELFMQYEAQLMRAMGPSLSAGTQDRGYR